MKMFALTIVLLLMMPLAEADEFNFTISKDVQENTSACSQAYGFDCAPALTGTGTFTTGSLVLAPGEPGTIADAITSINGQVNGASINSLASGYIVAVDGQASVDPFTSILFGPWDITPYNEFHPLGNSYQQMNGTWVNVEVTPVSVPEPTELALLSVALR